MQKILERVEGFAVVAKPETEDFEVIGKELDRLRLATSVRERGNCLLIIAAQAVAGLSQIDAEAESAQFREQARALLVAAQALGMGSMGGTEGGIAFYFREETGLRYDACDGAVDALANCVLQARKAKP